MDSNITLQEIRDYFLLPKPRLSRMEVNIYMVIAIALAFPILKLSLFSAILYVPLWVLFILLSYILFKLPYSKRRSKYDNRIRDDAIANYLVKICKNKIIKRVIEYLNIRDANDTKFIIIPYPVFNYTDNIKAKNIRRKKSQISSKTDDYCYNYSFWNIQILVINRGIINLYSCSYNLLDNEIINEHSKKCLYTDIASVSTEAKHINFESKWNKGTIEKISVLNLINYSGEKLSIIANLPSLKQPEQTSVDIEKIAQVIRHILRDAKKSEHDNIIRLKYNDKIPSYAAV